jgi:hypothetical protein
MSYKLTWEDKGALAHFKDAVNDQDLKEIVSRFYGHENFDSINYLLIDFLEVDMFGVASKTLRHIGAMDRAAAMSNPRVKVAMVTDNAAFIDQLSSYEKASQGSPWPLCYFTSTEEAREWIAT